MPKMIRAHFFTGILVLIPIAVVAWIVKAMMSWLWNFYVHFPGSQYIQAIPLFGHLIAFLAITAFILLFVSALGWISKLYLGKKLLSTLAEMLDKIPILGAIYSSLNQLIQTLTAGGSKQFRRVVYVEWPRKGMWTVGFVTGPTMGREAPLNHINVFIPTVPNPTSGFHMIVPEGEVKETHMSVEEAFKVILSLGMVHPTQTNHEKQ